MKPETILFQKPETTLHPLQHDSAGPYSGETSLDRRTRLTAMAFILTALII